MNLLSEVLVAATATLKEAASVVVELPGAGISVSRCRNRTELAKYKAISAHGVAHMVSGT